MKKYELQILRYHHDVITGEFVNVGIILFNKETRFLKCAVTHKYARLSKFFHAEKTASFVSQMIRSFESSAHRISIELTENLDFARYSTLEEITNEILPKDDSSLMCSEPIKGLSLDFNRTFDELYNRYILRYENSPQRESRSDEEAWSQVYKKYFDEFGITQKLSKHSLKTQNDNFEFNLSYKNGVWNLYNPVSFDLIDHEAIKDKVYKWKGRISEMETTREEIKIHLLLLYPENQNQKDKEFINKVLLSSTQKQNLTLHNEKNLKAHLTDLKKYIAKESK